MDRKPFLNVDDLDPARTTISIVPVPPHNVQSIWLAFKLKTNCILNKETLLIMECNASFQNSCNEFFVGFGINRSVGKPLQMGYQKKKCWN